jgi:hypothetical protein
MLKVYFEYEKLPRVLVSMSRFLGDKKLTRLSNMARIVYLSTVDNRHFELYC